MINGVWILDRLTKSEQACLHCLVLLTEGLQKVVSPPPGLLARLTVGMDHSLRAAVLHKATSALNQTCTHPLLQPDEAPALMPAEELIERLQAAINRGESNDILYQASSRNSPEYRHLTPLLVESLGDRYYLIACCNITPS